MLTFVTAEGSTWYRAVVVDVVTACLVARGGPQDVLNVMYLAEPVDGTPPDAVPSVGDSGTPFFDARGHLHSFLSALWLSPSGQTPRLLLVPATAALAQLRALPALRGYDIRGFASPSTVKAREEAMRRHASLPQQQRPRLSGGVAWGSLKAFINGAYFYFHAGATCSGDASRNVDAAAERVPLQSETERGAIGGRRGGGGSTGSGGDESSDVGDSVSEDKKQR
jgi:hypothetical protein